MDVQDVHRTIRIQEGRSPTDLLESLLFIEAIGQSPVSLNDWPDAPRRIRHRPAFVYRSIRGTKRPAGHV